MCSKEKAADRAVCALAIRVLVVNSRTRWRRIFRGLSQDGGRADFFKTSAPLSLINVYRTYLISVRFISLGSTFKDASYILLWTRPPTPTPTIPTRVIPSCTAESMINTQGGGLSLPSQQGKKYLCYYPFSLVNICKIRYFRTVRLFCNPIATVSIRY